MYIVRFEQPQLEICTRYCTAETLQKNWLYNIDLFDDDDDRVPNASR